jgi:hypothetical protein
MGISDFQKLGKWGDTYVSFCPFSVGYFIFWTCGEKGQKDT